MLVVVATCLWPSHFWNILKVNTAQHLQSWILGYVKHFTPHLLVFFSLVQNTPSGRRARRGHPQNPSTIAGRFLEQRAQSEAVREWELHGRRLDAVGHEVESWKRQAEAQVLIGNSVSEELEFKKKKLASKWMEEAAKTRPSLTA